MILSEKFVLILTNNITNLYTFHNMHNAYIINMCGIKEIFL